MRTYSCIYKSQCFVPFVTFCSLFPVGPRQDHAHQTIGQFQLVSFLKKDMHGTLVHQANEGNEELCPAFADDNCPKIALTLTLGFGK
jgi:hypothetical protein